MKVYVRKPTNIDKKYPEAITFPNTDAELTDGIIDELKMRRTLERFGKKIARQFKARGVIINTIGVQFIDKGDLL